MRNFDTLSALISESLGKILQGKRILNIYAKNRQSFEGWLTIELIEILSDLGYENLKPETVSYIDICSDDIALEIKIIKTGWYRLDYDVNKLQKSSSKLKILLFLYFPCKLPLDKTINTHLERVSSTYDLKYPVVSQFRFEDLSNGIIGLFNVTTSI